MNPASLRHYENNHALRGRGARFFRQSLRSCKKTAAFTLIELLIVLALIIIMATIGTLTLVSFRAQQSLRLASGNLTTFLRAAQQKAIGQEGSSQWGVHLVHQSGARDNYSLFSGAAFGSAASTVSLPSGVEFDPAYVPAAKDVVFNKLTGLPVGGADITIKLRLISDNTASRTITIYAQGPITD